MKHERLASCRCPNTSRSYPSSASCSGSSVVGLGEVLTMPAASESSLNPFFAGGCRLRSQLGPNELTTAIVPVPAAAC
jgi:hypothetical protein